MLCSGSTTRQAGRTNCELVHCEWTPHSRACQKIQVWSRGKRFDQALWSQHLDVALWQGSATPGYCRRGPRPGCSGRQPSPMLARGLLRLWSVAGTSNGRIFTAKDPMKQLMDLRRIENLWCFIEEDNIVPNILWYIAHTIFNAIYLRRCYIASKYNMLYNMLCYKAPPLYQTPAI